MDIITISNALIDKLTKGSMSMREINSKCVEIDNFKRNITDDSERKDLFEKSDMVDRVFIAMIEFAKRVASKKKNPGSVLDTFSSFYSAFAELNIYIPTEHALSQIHREIIDIIVILIPSVESDEELLDYWLVYFSFLMKITWFWNIFQSDDDKENLFSLITKFAVKFLVSSDEYLVQKYLDFIANFIKLCPYNLSSETAVNLYEILPKIVEKHDGLLMSVLEILILLIPKYPVNLALNSDLFSSPFSKSIIDLIVDRWKILSKNISHWKEIRIYLILFFDYADTVGFTIPEELMLRFYNAIEDMWTSNARKVHYLQPSNCVQYLKFDVEVFKRIPKENFDELKDVLGEALETLGPNSITSDFILLLTAIIKYSLNLFPREFWLKILNKISLNGAKLTAINKSEYIITPFIFLNAAAEQIEDTNIWDKFFIESIDFMLDTPDELQETFYGFICTLIKNQRISTKVAHKYQNNIWRSRNNDINTFCEGRLKSIHLMIYYYGFESLSTRKDCFMKLITVIEKIDKAPSNKAIKIITMLLCSIVQSHAYHYKNKAAPVTDFEVECEELSDRIRLGVKKPKKVFANEYQEPVKSQLLYVPSNDDSQIMEEIRDTFSLSQSVSTPVIEESTNEKKQPDNISLCNFINEDLQMSYVATLTNTKMNDMFDNYAFRLHRSFFAPKIFPIAQLLNDIAREYIKVSGSEEMGSMFIHFILLFNCILKEIDEESFQPFFEKIETSFYDDLSTFLSLCETEFTSIKKRSPRTSWKSLDDCMFSNYYTEIQDLTKFIAGCVLLVPEATDKLIESITSIFSITSDFPKLHVKLIKLILPLPMSPEHLRRCLDSLRFSLEKVLFDYIVPIRDREQFVGEVLDTISGTIVNTGEMQEIFILIKKYNLTVNMKCKILSIAKDRYVESPSLFNTLWIEDGNADSEDNDPFYILSQEQIVRLASIDPIVSVLKSSHIEGEEQDKCKTLDELFLPSLEGVFDSLDEFKEDAYTAIATLSKIASNVPELSMKCIIILINLFTKNDIKIFPQSTIDLLFSPLSTRVHYSVLLREFIPLIIKSLLNTEEFSLEHAPLRLFFADDQFIQPNIMQKRFFMIVAPYVVCYAVKNNKPDLIELTSRSLGISIQQLMDNTDKYLIPYLFASLCNATDEEEKNLCKEMYNDRTRDRSIYISSPIFLLDLLPLTNEEGINSSYQQLVAENKNPRFLDYHKTLLLLYSSVYKANHTVIQSLMLRKFSLYCSFIVNSVIDEVLESLPWVYVDMFVLSINMLEFAAPTEIYKNINVIAQNFPSSLKPNHVAALIEAFENLCIITADKMSIQEFHEIFEPLITSFRTNIPALFSLMLIVPQFKEDQIQNRTLGDEFIRISCTGRVNKEGINFMVKRMYDRPLNEQLVEGNGNLYRQFKRAKTINEERRAGMNTIYKFLEKEHYPPTVLIYTELYITLASIYPSPMIITGETDVKMVYISSLASYVRNKDPKIALAALEAIRFSKKQQGIQSQLEEDNMEPISEYAIFDPETSEVVVPTITDDAPWVSKAVVRMERDLGKDIVYYPSMELALLSADFASDIYPQIFFTTMLSPALIKKVFDEISPFQANPEKYVEENRIILKALVVVKNYIFAHYNDMQRGSRSWYINWVNVQLQFSTFSKIALKLGDPYLAYFFAEFSRETSDEVLDDDYFKQLFTKLGVNDLMYDLNIDVGSLTSVASIYEQERMMGRALLLYDQANILNDQMRSTLMNLQLNHLLLSQGPSTEAFWRLQKWDIPSSTLREMDINKHNTQLFRILQSFASTDTESIESSINDLFKSFAMRRTESVNDNIGMLLDTCTIQWFEAFVVGNNDLAKLFEKDLVATYHKFLKGIVESSKNNLSITESSAYLNGIFLSNNGFVSQLDKNFKLPNLSIKFFDEMIKVATDNNEVELAQSFVTLLRSGMTIPQPANFQQLCVLNKDSPIRAVSILLKQIDSILIDTTKRNSDITKDRAEVFNHKCRLTLAKWSAQTHFVESRKVISSLEELIAEAESTNEPDILADACIALARFEHNIHRESLSFFNSPEYTSIITLIQQLKAQYNSLKHKASKATRDIAQLMQNIEIHEKHVEIEKEKFSESILNAIRNYMKVLWKSDKYDLEALYSVINLWFNYSFSDCNKYLNDMPEIISEMEYAFDFINPKKFLPLFYQLAARIEILVQGETPCSSYKEVFQEFLHKVVKAVCYSAPDACLPVLFSLINNSETKGVVPLTGKIQTNTDRTREVNELIKNMCIEDSYLPPKEDGLLPGQYQMDISKRWEDMEYLLNGYLELGRAPIDDRAYLNNTAPSLCHLEDRKYLSVITNSNYPSIHRFSNKVQSLTGITKPVMIQLEATNGKKYRQILKSNRDDLRQDAVMEQLFSLASQLLEMKNHNLRIRNYKVIPLTPTAGLIECVRNSIPISDYLIGNEKMSTSISAHAHYATSETDNYETIIKEFRDASTAYHNVNSFQRLEQRTHPVAKPTEKKSPGSSLKFDFNGAKKLNAIPRRKDLSTLRMELVETFESITERFKPVFRFFFVEKFNNTGDWFKARMNYCRHTATNSMLGYVFGIGDRHLSNILIDYLNGEVVHIDLGVAFEQGKMLAVSEIVPFRLTGEIIDGFGHAGGMGVFRKSCEETLRLLRNNSEYLLTVLDVFMRDPLYNWSVVPRKDAAQKMRKFTPFSAVDDEAADIPPKTAESVIMRCRRKLEGNDSGEVLSVEGQVAQLICDASDHNNLAMMYTGWKPFL